MKAVVSCTNASLSRTMLQDLEIIAQLLNDHHLEPRELDRAEKLVKELAFLVRCRKWNHQQACLAEMGEALEGVKAPAGFADRVMERVRATAEPKRS